MFRRLRKIHTPKEPILHIPALFHLRHPLTALNQMRKNVPRNGIDSPLGFAYREFLFARTCRHDVQLNPRSSILRSVGTDFFAAKAHALLHAWSQNPFAAELFKGVCPNERAQFGIDGFDDRRQIIALDVRSKTPNETII